MTFWQKLFGWGKTAAKALGVALANFAKSQAVKDLISTELGLIAQSVVGNLNASTLTSAQKRQQAFDSISSQAKSAGIDFTSSVINLLIEVCLQNIKAK